MYNSKFPWSNWHGFNLDWVLNTVKELKTTVDDIISSFAKSYKGVRIATSFGISNEGDVDVIDKINEFIADTDDGNWFIFPKGDYLISNNLNVVDSCKIEFEEGARLVLSSSFQGDNVISGQVGKVKIINPQIDCTNLPAETRIYDGTFSPKGVAIIFTGTELNMLDSVQVKGGHITNADFPAVMMNYVKHAKVEELKTEDCALNVAKGAPATIYLANGLKNRAIKNVVLRSGMKGINVSSGNGGKILDNYIEHENEGHSALFSANEPNITIKGNEVQGANACKIDRANNATFANNKMVDCSLGMQVQGGSSVLITGNIIENNTGGDGLIISGHPTYALGVNDIIIKNNDIKIVGASTTTYGIKLFSQDLPSFEYKFCKDIKIEGNIIDGGQNGIHASVATGSEYRNISITDNEIRNSAGFAISTQGEDYKIQNNVIRDIGVSGIYVDDSTVADSDSEIIITGNKFKDIAGYGVNFIAMGGATGKEPHNSMVIANNSFTGLGNHAIALAIDLTKFISIMGNLMSKSTGTRIVNLQGDDTTAQVVNIQANTTDSKEIKFASALAMSGKIGGNVATVSGKPANVKQAQYEL